MIVYSTLFGGYDSAPAAPFSDKYPHFLYTDGPAHAPGWQVVVVPQWFLSPRLESRKYKLQPHLLFPGEEALYHDANMTLLIDPKRIHRALTAGTSVGMVHHNRNHTLREEFAAVRKYSLADPELLALQEIRYSHLMDKHIAQCGLMALTPDAEPLMSTWWEEVISFSPRDQLSLPWAAEKSKIEPSQYRSLSGLVRMTIHLKERIA